MKVLYKYEDDRVLEVPMIHRLGLIVNRLISGLGLSEFRVGGVWVNISTPSYITIHRILLGSIVKELSDFTLPQFIV